ncbi:SUMF1/EgtB/PvdO family nonheme iron enzyme [Halopseudomonas sp. SMJS2]|uniref:formylglycine-generating enzyme family protein n=1 Tax=Halopseudomonas sp. SMJS2 TaxID=3041098 RepID=UPI002452CFC6|nr:SUMF1/EgtB/PvdO family nonheme iron enzyme [Halopseudomonas sp. SMJS2]WGK62216.1 SUMF1/EgtB/PvdO family nonheme iron enzyme [Halopseudomonas sp. SMJS2]
MLKIIKYSLLPVTCSAVFGCQSNHSASDIDRMVSELTEKAVLDQVFIEGGTFVMGDFGAVQNGQWLPYFPPAAAEDIAHEVTVSSFFLSKYETTWGDFDLFSIETGRPVVLRSRGEEIKRAPFEQNVEQSYYEKKPARVSWQEAKDYCLWLAEKTNLAFDLPTSAQWEFAARNRGSKEWLYPTHDGQLSAGYEAANMDGCVTWTRVCPVGQQFPANPLGLYDMAGNIEEWVNDWYSDTYYQESHGAKDPLGPPEGKLKETRGHGLGSLDFSFTRAPTALASHEGFLTEAGFRCAVQSPEPIH